MTAREEIRAILVNTYGDDVRASIALESIDLIIVTMIGMDDTMTDEMPRTWNEGLKKQYVNFRNHLRRALRNRYGSK